MRKQYRLAASVLIVSLVLVPATARAAGAPNLGIVVKDGKVTLNVKNADVLDVLREVCRQADIELAVKGNVPETVTRKMKSVPLMRALKKLLRRQNYEMVLGSGESDTVSAVGVFPPGETISPRWNERPKAPTATPKPKNPAPHQGPALTYEEKLKRTQAMLRMARAQKASGKGEGAGLLPGVAVGGTTAASDAQETSAAAATQETTGAGDAATESGSGAQEEPMAPLRPESAPYVKDLSDTDPQIRQTALLALAEIGGQAEFALVASTLKNDKDDNVRLTAAEALKGKAAGDTLSQLMKSVTSDRNVQVREASAEALGRIGDLRSAQTLILALADSNQFVSDAAYAALSKMAGQGDKLKSILESAQNTAPSGAHEKIDSLLELVQMEAESTHDG